MAEPSKKSPEMEKLIDTFNPSGRKRVDSVKADICAWCGEPATKFKDDLSRKEYTISGFCQECQDKTFGETQPEVDIGIGVITLQRPAWGYCVMKCLRDLGKEEYAHLPDFSTVEEHGRNNPVILRHSDGKEICQMGWDEFKKVYVMD